MHNESAQQVMDYLKRNSSYFLNPNAEYGYGIPDFVKAGYMLRENEAIEAPGKPEIFLFPNPVEKELYLSFSMNYDKDEEDVNLRIFDMAGRLKHRESRHIFTSWSILKLEDLSFLPAGLYMLNIQIGSETASALFTKK